MTSLTVRPATGSDSGPIMALLRQASLPTADLADATHVRFWVADAGGEILGAVALEQYGDAGLLRSLVVAPATRGRGIGIELVATLEQEARLLGIAQLVLLTNTARPFFERLEYAVTDRETVPDAVRASQDTR